MEGIGLNAPNASCDIRRCSNANGRSEALGRAW